VDGGLVCGGWALKSRTGEDDSTLVLSRDFLGLCVGAYLHSYAYIILGRSSFLTEHAQSDPGPEAIGRPSFGTFVVSWSAAQRMSRDADCIFLHLDT
jgi:hypothetical protein